MMGRNLRLNKQPEPRFRCRHTGCEFFCRIFLTLLITFGLLNGLTFTIRADGLAPRRQSKQYMALAQHWQLATWKEGKSVCNIFVRHEGLPNYDEIVNDCGQDIYIQWSKTPPCPAIAGGGTGSSCEGLVAHLLGNESHLFTEYVEVPSITLQVKPINCLPGKWCNVPPELIFSAQEPVSGFNITGIHVMMEGFEHPCKGDTCRLGLPLTPDKGYHVEYWADSNFGDHSDHKLFMFRNVLRDEKSITNFRMDLLNDETQEDAGSGSLIWDIFPPLNYQLQNILEQPVSYRELNTTNSYLYLGGNLIRAGKVNAAACPSNGLLPNGFANPCGAQISNDEMIDWQNRYDTLIYKAALKNNVPARVIKAIIAQESQFWPSSDSPYELGLGMMTENGLDMLLLWNQDYFHSICKPLLDDKTCQSGYTNLTVDQKYLLKSVLLKQIGTEGEIDILAATILASEIQTNQLVKNATAESPANVISYEDMWRITIANYYTGSGCLENTLNSVFTVKKQLLWDDIVNQLPSACTLAKKYVENVLGTGQPQNSQNAGG